MNNEKRYKFLPQKDTGRLSESDTKKYFSTLGFAVCAFMLTSFGSSLLVAVALNSLAPWVLKNDILSNLINVACQYGIGLPAAVLVLRRLPKDVNPSEKLSFKGFLGFFCVCLTFMSVGSNIATAVMTFAESLTGRAITNPVESSTEGTHWAVNLVFFAILAPVLEELLFRKLICDRLLPLGEGYAVLLSAAVFGLAHGNFYQFFYAFLVGAIFSYVYIKTGNLVYTTVFHVLINLLGGVVAPWTLNKLEPLFTEENIKIFGELMAVGDIDKFMDMVTPYSWPIVLLYVYVLVFNVGSIIGFVVLMKNLRRVRFREGLLPPAKEGRVANLFLNGGVFAAITVFAGIFLLSLLA